MLGPIAEAAVAVVFTPPIVCVAVVLLPVVIAHLWRHPCLTSCTSAHEFASRRRRRGVQTLAHSHTIKGARGRGSHGSGRRAVRTERQARLAHVAIELHILLQQKRVLDVALVQGSLSHRLFIQGPRRPPIPRLLDPSCCTWEPVLRSRTRFVPCIFFLSASLAAGSGGVLGAAAAASPLPARAPARRHASWQHAGIVAASRPSAGAHLGRDETTCLPSQVQEGVHGAV